MKKSDLPPSLRLHGLSIEDVPEIMALFHSCIRLHAPDGTPDSVVDHHAVRYLARLVNGGAAITLHQVQRETLEWRIDKELAQLNTEDVEVRAPRNWSEWVDVFPNLFSPVNRIVLLTRTVSTLQQGSSVSVDSCGLRVTQAYARLLTKAKQTAPANVSPYKHAWQTLLVATFEAGLTPHVRLELIRPLPYILSLMYPRQKTQDQRLTRGRAVSAFANYITSVCTFWSKKWSLGLFGRLYMLFIHLDRPHTATKKYSSKPCTQPTSPSNHRKYSLALDKFNAYHTYGRPTVFGSVRIA